MAQELVKLVKDPNVAGSVNAREMHDAPPRDPGALGLGGRGDRAQRGASQGEFVEQLLPCRSISRCAFVGQVGVVPKERRCPSRLPTGVQHPQGVLAGVLDELRNEGINIEEMENTIFEGGEAACCTLKLDDKPSEKLVGKIRSGENIIQVLLQ